MANQFIVNRLRVLQKYPKAIDSFRQTGIGMGKAHPRYFPFKHFFSLHIQNRIVLNFGRSLKRVDTGKRVWIELETGNLHRPRCGEKVLIGLLKTDVYPIIGLTNFGTQRFANGEIKRVPGIGNRSAGSAKQGLGFCSELREEED